MATFGEIQARTVRAVSDLSDKQYHIVRNAGERLTDVASNANAAFAVGAIGVLQNKPLAGNEASVGYAGESIVVAGAAVAAGVMITTNGAGRAITAASGNIIVGRTITAAGAAGEQITALLFPPVRLSGAV